MTGFQILALTALGTLLIVTGWMKHRGRLSPRTAYLWIVIWFAAGLTVAIPSMTARVAQWLGVGRGVDLVLYSALLAFLGAYLFINARLRRIEHEITVITRHIALNEASRAEPSDTRAGAGAPPVESA